MLFRHLLVENLDEEGGVPLTVFSSSAAAPFSNTDCRFAPDFMSSFSEENISTGLIERGISVNTACKDCSA
jgi:hypothetical protein